MSQHKVAFLTAGGLAPCLSSAIGFLIDAYNHVAPDAELIAYRDGYKGLLLGDSFTFDGEMRERAFCSAEVAAQSVTIGSSSPISTIASSEDSSKKERRHFTLQPSNSKTALQSSIPLGAMIRTQPRQIWLSISKTTTTRLPLLLGYPKLSTMTCFQSRRASAHSPQLSMVPISSNIVHESSANPRMLIVHEVMGRNCGWLTAATARAYRSLWGADSFLESVTSRSNSSTFMPFIFRKKLSISTKPNDSKRLWTSLATSISL